MRVGEYVMSRHGTKIPMDRVSKVKMLPEDGHYTVTYYFNTGERFVDTYEEMAEAVDRVVAAEMIRQLLGLPLETNIRDS